MSLYSISATWYKHWSGSQSKSGSKWTLGIILKLLKFVAKALQWILSEGISLCWMKFSTLQSCKYQNCLKFNMLVIEYQMKMCFFETHTNTIIMILIIVVFKTNYYIVLIGQLIWEQLHSFYISQKKCPWYSSEGHNFGRAAGDIRGRIGIHTWRRRRVSIFTLGGGAVIKRRYWSNYLWYVLPTWQQIDRSGPETMRSQLKRPRYELNDWKSDRFALELTQIGTLGDWNIDAQLDVRLISDKMPATSISPYSVAVYLASGQG